MLSFKSFKEDLATSMSCNLVEGFCFCFQPQVTARPAKYLAQPTAQEQRPSGVGRGAKKLCYGFDEFVATSYVQFSSTPAQCLFDGFCQYEHLWSFATSSPTARPAKQLAQVAARVVRLGRVGCPLKPCYDFIEARCLRSALAGCTAVWHRLCSLLPGEIFDSDVC